MTASQNAVYAFLRDFRDRRGFAPTYREIAAGVGLSFQRVHQIVGELKQAGVVKHETDSHRSLELCLIAESGSLDTLKAD